MVELIKYYDKDEQDDKVEQDPFHSRSNEKSLGKEVVLQKSVKRSSFAGSLDF